MPIISGVFPNQGVLGSLGRMRSAIPFAISVGMAALHEDSVFGCCWGRALLAFGLWDLGFRVKDAKYKPEALNPKP